MAKITFNAEEVLYAAVNGVDNKTLDKVARELDRLYGLEMLVKNSLFPAGFESVENSVVVPYVSRRAIAFQLGHSLLQESPPIKVKACGCKEHAGGP